MEPNTNDTPKRGLLGKWSQANPKLFYTALAMLTGLFVWAVLATTFLGLVKTDLEVQRASADKERAAMKADYEIKLANARNAGLRQTAAAAAATLAPFVALQGQVPEITNRNLQAAVRNLVQNRDLRFVAVSDGSGTVVAASDLTLVGRQMATPPGMEIATAPIGADGASGSITLGLR